MNFLSSNEPEMDKNNGNFLDNFPEFKENIFPGQENYIQSCTNYFCQSGYYERFLAKKNLNIENPTQVQIFQLIKEEKITNELIKKEIIRQSHSLSVGYRFAKTLFASKGISESDFELYSQNVMNACFLLARKNNITLGPSIINFALLCPLESPTDWRTENIDLYRIFNEYFATLWQSKKFDLGDENQFQNLIKTLKEKTDGRKGVRGEDLSVDEEKIKNWKKNLATEKRFAMNIGTYYAQELIFGAKKILNPSFENLDFGKLENILIAGEKKKLKILGLNAENDKKNLLKGQKIFFLLITQAIWQTGYFQEKYKIKDEIFFQIKKEIIAELNPILLAYVFVKQAYREKNRKSGERFFEHFKGVIHDYLAIAKVSGETISPRGVLLRLLHDIKEDNLIDTASLSNIFGPDIAYQIDNLSKRPDEEYIKYFSPESEVFHEYGKQKKGEEVGDYIQDLAKNFRDQKYFGKYQQIDRGNISQSFETFLAKFDDRINNLSTLQDVGTQSQINQIWQTINFFYPACQNYINYFSDISDENSKKNLKTITLRFGILHILIKSLLAIFLNPDLNRGLDYGKGLKTYQENFEKIKSTHQYYKNFELQNQKISDSQIFSNQSLRLDQIDLILQNLKDQENIPKDFFESDIGKIYLLGEKNFKNLEIDQKIQIGKLVQDILKTRHFLYLNQKKSNKKS